MTERRRGKRGNGEGGIRKRSDGRWEATVSLEDGRRKYFYGSTREEVAKKLANALKRRMEGLPIPSDRRTVASFLDDWLVTAKPTLRPETWRRYESLVRTHAKPSIGRLSLTKLTPARLQRLYNSLLDAGRAPATVRQLHAVLHRAQRQAERRNLVVRNVASLVEAPRIPRRQMQTLSAEQAQRLLSEAESDKLEALYSLALTTGMRRGELLALRWKDVDLDKGMLRVCGTLHRTKEGSVITEPKTASSRRRIELGTGAVEALRRHHARQAEGRLAAGPKWTDLGLVFADDQGMPLEPSGVLVHSFWPLERSGIPRIRFHDLRHTAATLLLEGGIHPKVASEMLGHSRTAVTLDLYSHVTPTMQRHAADTLDAILSR